jgi:hypothetical protein
MTKPSHARLETLAVLMETVIPAILSPTPAAITVRGWFDDWRIPRYKANALCRHGGGRVYYSVPHVERALRARVLPGRFAQISPLHTTPQHTTPHHNTPQHNTTQQR